MTRIKGISVLLLETPLTRSKYIFPTHTHTQRLTRTSGTFYTFAVTKPLKYPFTVGLGVLSGCFLQARELWLNVLQESQKTLSVQLNLKCPRSPHLKHIGPLLPSVPVTLIVLCVPTVVPALLLCRHVVLRFIGLVVLVVG